MDLQRLLDGLLDVVRRNQEIVELVVFLLGFAESLVLVSFFVPASALFVGIAALEGAADGSFIKLLLAGTLGAFLGDLVSFHLGKSLKDELPRRWPFRSHPGWLVGARVLFDRWGASAVVISKFAGPLRPVVPVVAGAAMMPWLPFALASLVSCFLWAALFLGPAFYGVKLISS